MAMEFPQKIHIIGSVGSGKTTLARSLSKTLQLPFHELDNVVWIRKPSGDMRRTEQERQEYLQSIIQTDGWIIEGIHQEEWVTQSFSKRIVSSFWIRLIKFVLLELLRDF